MIQRLLGITLVLSLCTFATPVLSAQPAIQPAADITKVPPAAQPSPHFDADAATEAYMAMMPPAAIARSNAYFEGGYWLILWDFVYGAVISLLLLNLRWSARMRDLAVRLSRFRWVQTMIYWIEYDIVTLILGFPLAWYEGLFREQKYGLATQTFGPWMGDQMKAISGFSRFGRHRAAHPLRHRPPLPPHLVARRLPGRNRTHHPAGGHRSGLSAAHF